MSVNVKCEIDRTSQRLLTSLTQFLITGECGALLQIDFIFDLSIAPPTVTKPFEITEYT